jgi:NADH:ubiquinone oxidoreductase subunit F (NADH-binding)
MARARSEAKDDPRIVLRHCGQIDPESLAEATAAGAYEALRKVVRERISREAVVDEVTRSGLRGRGGAGFPTGRKWSLTAKGDPVYLIGNADEGEPGTFKDRLILEGDPHELVEGMILAGYAIGAKRGFVYLRGEYTRSIERMTRAIDQAREAGFLGENLLGSGISFDLEVRRGAGAYVCGDETALIESMEGKRGFPRVKPPYPGQVGLWGQPTVVNNVETLANVPSIVLRGAEWFRSFGTPTSPGTKVFLVIGDVERPGAVEAEMGIPLRELVDRHGGGVRGGKRFKGALVGGAAGAFVSARELDVAMDFDSLRTQASATLGSGSVLVLNEEASIPEVLGQLLEFFEHESCGQCTPCRAGTPQLVRLLRRALTSERRGEDLDRLLSLARAMRDTSLCPLGQSPILPVESAMRHFRDEFLACVATA